MDHNRKQSDTTSALPYSIEYNVPLWMRIDEYLTEKAIDEREPKWPSNSLKTLIDNYIEEKKVSLRSLAEMVGHTYGATATQVYKMK